MVKENIIICDIDGTIADIRHRLHYIESKPKDWESFYSDYNLEKDTPFLGIINILKPLNKDTAIFFLTGRHEFSRQITLNWLKKHIAGVYSFRLYMRLNKNYEKDYIFKFNVLKSIREQFNIVLAIEDRDKVVEMYIRMGIPVLQHKY